MANPVPAPVGGNYDPYVALEFFKSAGTPVEFKEGKTIFAEKEKAIPVLRRNKMYLLLKGEVGLMHGKNAIAIVKPGEIFGELAVISDAPRSASALTRTPCTVIGLDDDDFGTALKKKPAFAVMLLGVMIRRMREAVARLKERGALSPTPPGRNRWCSTRTCSPTWRAACPTIRSRCTAPAPPSSPRARRACACTW